MVVDDQERAQVLRTEQPAPLHRLGICLRAGFSRATTDSVDDEMTRLLMLLSQEPADHHRSETIHPDS